MIFLLIFGFQVGVGAMLSWWPTDGGRYPASAHVTVWFSLIALQGASAVWYFLPSRVLIEGCDTQAACKRKFPKSGEFDVFTI